jgi:hypothetical protein
MSETVEGVAQVTTNAAPETKVDAQPDTKVEPVAAANDTVLSDKKTDEPIKTEAVELKLPEHSLLDASAVERISAYAKQKGLDNTQAQMLLERESEAVSQFRADQESALKTKATEWKAELLKDQEFGGEAFAKNAELAKRALQKYADPSFVEVLESTGLGNHPALVKMLYRIGKAQAEDSFVNPSAHGAQNKDIADVFYGSKS